MGSDEDRWARLAQWLRRKVEAARREQDAAITRTLDRLGDDADGRGMNDLALVYRLSSMRLMGDTAPFPRRPDTNE